MSLQLLLVVLLVSFSDAPEVLDLAFIGLFELDKSLLVDVCCL